MVPVPELRPLVSLMFAVPAAFRNWSPLPAEESALRFVTLNSKSLPEVPMPPLSVRDRFATVISVLLGLVPSRILPPERTGFCVIQAADAGRFLVRSSAW